MFKKYFILAAFLLLGNASVTFAQNNTVQKSEWISAVKNYEKATAGIQQNELLASFRNLMQVGIAESKESIRIAQEQNNENKASEMMQLHLKRAEIYNEFIQKTAHPDGFQKSEVLQILNKYSLTL